MPNRKAQNMKFTHGQRPNMKMQPKTTKNRRLENGAKFYSDGTIYGPLM